MTDHPTAPSRFVLRKGAVAGKWMVWDRQLRGLARLERGKAAELSEEDARKIIEQLKRTYDK